MEGNVTHLWHRFVLLEEARSCRFSPATASLSDGFTPTVSGDEVMMMVLMQKKIIPWSDLWRGNCNKSKSDRQTWLASLQGYRLYYRTLILANAKISLNRKMQVYSRLLISVSQFFPNVKCPRGHPSNQIRMRTEVISAWKHKHF